MENIRYPNESVIAKKSYAFALDIISLYKILIGDKKEFVLSKQLIRAGTSVGANINEAVCAQSKRDFVHKLSIALKEARETLYWLNLLKDSDYINRDLYQKLSLQCIELNKILSSIILTNKQKYFRESVKNS